jgi:hypothetical protein
MPSAALQQRDDCTLWYPMKMGINIERAFTQPINQMKKSHDKTKQKEYKPE